MNGRISHERGQEMRAAIERKRQSFLEAQIGLSLSAVTLAEAEGGGRAALATNYLKLLLPETDVSPGTLLDVRVGRVHGGTLYGYPVQVPPPAPPAERAA